MNPVACTIIARNYLAQARVLAQSFADHHPDGVLHVLVLDDIRGSIGADEAFTVLRPADVMDEDTFHSMATMYSIVELATAVKPWLLAYLVARDGAPVAYFDPDIEIFTPLNDIYEAAQANGLALTPHLLAPPARLRGATAIEDVVLGVGVFNLGFIAVGTNPAPLEWWKERLRTDCIIAPPESRFVDQRWADLMPAYFTPAILRDPGMNVAWWNLSTRNVTHDGDGYKINGHPLRFFHFSGVDPEMPWMVSRHQGPVPQVLMSNAPELQRITTEYCDRLWAHGYREWSRIPYELDEVSRGQSVPLDTAMRRAYRDAFLDHHHLGGPLPPDPFTDGSTAFMAWLAEDDPLAVGPSPSSRYAHARWKSDEALQVEFRDPHGHDSPALAEKLRSTGPGPQHLVGTPNRPQRGRRAHAGYTVIAPLAADTPEGTIGRRLVRTMRNAGIPCEAVQLASDAALNGRAEAPKGALASATANIFVVQPADIGAAAYQLGDARLHESRNVLAYASRFGRDLGDRSPLALFDEQWAFSNEAAAQRRRLSGAPPVHVLPVPAIAADRSEAGRVIVVSLDATPGAEPGGADEAIEAFLQSDACTEGCQLQIAVRNASADVLQVERIRYLVDKEPSIDVIAIADDGAAVPSDCACLLWLPRHGDAALAVLDAASAGIPVIASPHGAALDMPQGAVRLANTSAEAAKAIDAVLATSAPRPSVPSTHASASSVFLRERLNVLSRTGRLHSRIVRATRRLPRAGRAR